jgi:septum formation protein
VVGADTVVSIDDEILGKPKDEEDAVHMLLKLSGRKHQVYTGVTLIFPATEEKITFAVKTDVHVYPITEEAARRYAATGDPLDKAGAYGIQGTFAAYISGITGDYNNVVGLPIGHICQVLRERGLL